MKNVRVIDEQGNEYEATYLKRAKGLVKKGRARFLSDNVICLACPPNISDLEDSQMKDFMLFGKKDTQSKTAASEVKAQNEEKTVTFEFVGEEKVPEVPKTEQTATENEKTVTFELSGEEKMPETPKSSEPAPQEEISTAYLLEQLAAIQRDNTYLKDAMEKVAQMGRGDETRAGVLADMVKARETTNQRLISTYSELLRRKNPSKLPNFDDFGKKWNGWKDKAKATLEESRENVVNVTVQAEKVEEQVPVEEVTENSAWNVDETIRRTMDKAMDIARQAVKGTKEAYNNLTVTVHSNKPSESATRLDMMTSFLRNKSLTAKDKELFFDHLDELLELEASAREKLMNLLTDVTVSGESKESLFDYLDEIANLDKAMQDKALDTVLDLLRDGAVHNAEKELFFDYLDDIAELEQSLQEKVLDILRDSDLTAEEKTVIFEHLEDLT